MAWTEKYTAAICEQSAAGYPGIFTETIPYKGTWVYATRCKLVNKTDNTEQSVYLPAVHKSAYPFLSNLMDGFVAADNSGKYDQEALASFRKKLDTILNDLSSIYTKHTGREVQIRADDVELLPIGGKDHSENVYSIESIEDPAMSKQEAYHIAMDLVDLFRIQQQVDAEMEALKKDKHD